MIGPVAAVRTRPATAALLVEPVPTSARRDTLPSNPRVTVKSLDPRIVAIRLSEIGVPAAAAPSTSLNCLLLLIFDTPERTANFTLPSDHRFLTLHCVDSPSALMTPLTWPRRNTWPTVQACVPAAASLTSSSIGIATPESVPHPPVADDPPCTLNLDGGQGCAAKSAKPGTKELRPTEACKNSLRFTFHLPHTCERQNSTSLGNGVTSVPKAYSDGDEAACMR